jgi:sialic acid synthase
LNNPFVIAEIGCNHKGAMEIAHEMITTASIFCKVDAVKFQKRTPKELLTEEEYNTPHPNPVNSFGDTYGEHREYLEFDQAQHRQLKDWCEELGLTYSVSVWDLTSAKEMVQLNPGMLKIPSACNLKFGLLEYLCDEFGGEIHLSMGMTTREEEKEIIEFFEKRGRNNDLVIYACTSGYPVAFEDICLFEIKRLKEAFGQRVKGVGFSGHHLGIAADVAAMTLGAMWVERHFTLDRTWKGTDHAASLEPDGMRRVARDLRSVHKALAYKPQEILEVEVAQRKKLKRFKDA